MFVKNYIKIENTIDFIRITVLAVRLLNLRIYTRKRGFINKCIMCIFSEIVFIYQCFCVCILHGTAFLGLFDAFAAWKLTCGGSCLSLVLPVVF